MKNARRRLGLVNNMFVSLDQAILTSAAIVLAAAAGLAGAALSRAVPAGLAPANDNAPLTPPRRRRRRQRGIKDPFAALGALRG